MQTEPTDNAPCKTSHRREQRTDGRHHSRNWLGEGCPPNRTLLRALVIRPVGGLHDDLLARRDEGRHHHLRAIRHHRRLVGGRRRLPLHHRVSLDHLEHDRLRQVHRDRLALDELDVDRHVLLQEGQAVTEDILRHHRLLEGLRVHQHQVGAVDVGVGELLVLGLQPLDRVGGTPALVLLGACLDVAHVHLDDGIAFPRDHDVLLDDGVALAFELDDHAGTHLVGLHLCHLRFRDLGEPNANAEFAIAPPLRAAGERGKAYPLCWDVLTIEAQRSLTSKEPLRLKIGWLRMATEIALGVKMKILRFTGSRIHKFKDFSIDFQNDLTFLIGINGSGKSTVLYCIMALISPNLSYLAELDFGEMAVDVKNGEKKYTIGARRAGRSVVLFCSEVQDTFIFHQNIKESDQLPGREAEIEAEYYRSILSANADHPVVKIISDLPTPMFLGLDRRALALGDPYRARWSMPRSAVRPSRNVFSALLSRSLVEATNLAENTYRDALIAVGRISDTLRQKMLLDLLEIKPGSGFGSNLISPAKSDIKEIQNMRNKLNFLPAMLRLPVEQVQSRVAPFLDFLEAAAAKIPEDLKKLTDIRKSESEQAVKALFDWTFNRPQLDRLTKITKTVGEYTEERQKITSTTDNYLKLLNAFFKDSAKTIAFDERGYLSFSIKGDDLPQPITTISSGEAQIFVIITHLLFNPLANEGGIFIIDEPELSLHIQWQELFVDSVMAANPKIQYIMATHSPSIILDRVERCVDVAVRPKLGPKMGAVKRRKKST